MSGRFEVTPEALRALQGTIEQHLTHAEGVRQQTTARVHSAGTTGSAKVDRAVAEFNQTWDHQAGQMTRVGRELKGTVGHAAQSYEQTERHLAGGMDQGGPQ